MNKFNEIDISITKAAMTKLDVELTSDGNVDISVRGVLLTEGGQVVSDFWLNNGSYITESKKIEIPAKVHHLISEIYKELTPVIYKKLNDAYKQLPESKTKKESKIVEDATPFNPDDVPF